MIQKSRVDFIKIIAGLVGVSIITCAIIFKIPLWDFLPLVISVSVLFMQTGINRYAFILGGINSCLYAVANIRMTLYVSAAYALLVSFPLQIITFLLWQKNTERGKTKTKNLSTKGRLVLFGTMVVGWVLLYGIFSIFNSEYLVLDNTIAILGIVGSVLCLLRYSEYSVLSLLSTPFNIYLYTVMTISDPSRVVWLIFNVYSLVCNVTTFIRMNKRGKENAG